jgi:hypothetical protein
MSDLWNVSYTRRVRGVKLDGKNKVIGEIIEDIPVTLTMLPLSTAESYKDCDNYERTRYIPAHQKVGVQTTSQRKAEHHKHWDTKKVKPAPVVDEAEEALKVAARTGNLGAAVSA